MFYNITAYNSNNLYVWASHSSDVDRYVDWLNRKREINLYAASVAPQDQWAALENNSEVMSCDEAYWDDFMDEDAE